MSNAADRVRMISVTGQLPGVFLRLPWFLQRWAFINTIHHTHFLALWLFDTIRVFFQGELKVFTMNLFKIHERQLLLRIRTAFSLLNWWKMKRYCLEHSKKWIDKLIRNQKRNCRCRFGLCSVKIGHITEYNFWPSPFHKKIIQIQIQGTKKDV